MNPYEQLDHEKRAWDVKETAEFLGYSRKYLYTLIREGKMDGCWTKLKSDYRFCPAKLKVWMETRFQNGGLPPEPDDKSDNHPKKEDDDEAAQSI